MFFHVCISNVLSIAVHLKICQNSDSTTITNIGWYENDFALPTITHHHHPSTTQTQCQQYFSYYWHEFDQTFQVTLVRTTFVLAAFPLPELKSMTLFWPKVKATVVLVTFVLPLWTKILLTPPFSVNQIFLTKHFLYPSKIQKQNTKTGNTGFLHICN